MRRLAASLALLFPLAALAPAPADAAATSPGVTLSLLRQTPWNTPEQPTLNISVRAANNGPDALAKLSLEVTIYTPTRSRTAYVQSLSSDPENPAVQYAQPTVLLPDLGAGAVRTISTAVDLNAAGLAARGENAVYPMKIELRSSDRPVATLRSPVVFLDFPKGQTGAKTPLRLSWAFVMDAPVLFGPDGAFDQDRVARFLAPGARLRQELGALTLLLTGNHAQSVDLVLSPLLVSQLQRLRDGYRARVGDTVQRMPAGQGEAADAAAALATLDHLLQSPLVEVSAMPLFSPDVPALLFTSVAGDLGMLVGAGRAVVAGLGVIPSRILVRPPDSYLDQRSLYNLSRLGFDQFLVDSSLVVRPPADREFALPATAALSAAPPSSLVTAIVPDQGIESLLASPPGDPKLTAQAVLGELAQVWLEQPGKKRGLVLSLAEDERLPGALFASLLHGISTAPWLKELTITQLAREFPPPAEPAELAPKVGPRYPTWYVARLVQARHDIDTYRSILVKPSPLPDELETHLLVAEAVDFASAPQRGAAFVDAVEARLHGEFAKIGADTSTPVTLASRNGVIPVSILNGTGQPVRVSIHLVSPRLLPVPAQRVKLTGHETTVFFHVQARTTGRFPVVVQIFTPDGKTPLGLGHELVIRSTAYNIVALIITIGAAVFLMAWWARRFLPRFRAGTT